MLNGKVFRISLGILILFVIAFASLPYLYKYYSADAVINARTITLRSPIKGFLHFSKPTKYGTYFRANEEIGKVINDRVQESFLYKLNTEKKTLEARISSLEECLTTFIQLKNSLNTQMNNYQKYFQNQTTIAIQQEQEKLEQEQSEYERSKKEYEDASKLLVVKNVISQRLLETHQANYGKSKDRLDEIEQRISDLNNTLEAAKAGVFIGVAGWNNDSPYSKQRMDQLVIELSLGKTALEEAKYRLEGINVQIIKETERINKAKCFNIVSPFDALVWRMVPGEGSVLAIDSEIVVLFDCSSIFLDATVSESQYSDIAPGERVQYKLLGEVQYHYGTVISLRGSGSIAGDQNLVASPIKDPKKEFQVWININPSDLKLTPENYYMVGRRVEVGIIRKWNPFRAFIRFWNVL